MFRNLAYSTRVRRRAPACCCPVHDRRRPVARRRRVRQVLVRAALGSIFETLMDFGLHQVTDPRRRARQVTRRPSLLQHTLAHQAGVGGRRRSRCSSSRRPSCVRSATCGSPAICIGGSLVLRSYMLTIRGVLQGLERFGWDSVVVDRRPRTAARLRAVALARRRRPARPRRSRSCVGARRRARAGRVADARAARRRRPPVRPRRLARPAQDGAAARLLSRRAEPVLVRRRRDARRRCARMRRNGTLRRRVSASTKGFTLRPLVIVAVLTPRLSALFATDRARIAAWRLAASPARRRSARRSRSSRFLVATPLIVLLFGAELRGCDRAVSDPLRRTAVRVRDLGAARDRDLGRSRAPAA